MYCNAREGTQPLDYNASHMPMQGQRACSKIRRDEAKNNQIEMTPEVSILTSKTNPLRKKIFLSQKSPRASRCLSTAVSEQQGSKIQKLGRSVKKNTKIETKNSSQNIVFSRNFSQKNRLKDFLRNPKVT